MRISLYDSVLEPTLVNIEPKIKEYLDIGKNYGTVSYNHYMIRKAFEKVTGCKIELHFEGVHVIFYCVFGNDSDLTHFLLKWS